MLVVVAACGGGGGPTSPSSASIAAVEHGSFELVNEERQVRGVSPILGSDPELAAIARAFSEQMRDEGFFSHTSPSGVTLGQRLAARGYQFSSAGENLARVSNSGNPASFAHQLLMKNPNHRGNILNSQYVQLGVGVAFKGDTVWITQIYARR